MLEDWKINYFIILYFSPGVFPVSYRRVSTETNSFLPKMLSNHYEITVLIGISLLGHQNLQPLQFLHKNSRKNFSGTNGLKSGVFLDLSEKIDSRISFSVSGTEVKLKECSL